MAQLINSTVTNLDAATGTTSSVDSFPVPINEFVPVRALTNSVASSSPDGNPSAAFEFRGADIPDHFATTEQPKLKFLFTVKFYPRTELTSLPELGDEHMDTMKFALKKAGRPNPTVTYQDVNFYGYRTKVAVKMDYGTVTLSFYDDVVNRAHNIISQYIRAISPIAAATMDQADQLDGAQNGAISIGSLSSQYGPFKAMRVTHHMLDNNSNNPTKPKQVYYDYLNPKIVNVNLDELDMTQSDVSTIDLVFVYDSVNISYSDQPPGNPLAVNSSGSPIVNSITNAVSNALPSSVTGVITSVSSDIPGLSNANNSLTPGSGFLKGF